MIGPGFARIVARGAGFVKSFLLDRWTSITFGPIFQGAGFVKL